MLAALAASALARPAAAEDMPDTISLGGVGSGFGRPFGTALFGIAQSRHTIEDQFAGTNVKVSWQYFSGTGPEINEALATDHLDFAQYGSLPAIIARANGLATHLIMDGGNTNIYGFARADLPISSVHDLKGRRVTVQKATILHWSLLTTLHANGMTDSDVTIVDLKLADQMAALTAGSVDAAFGTSNLLPLRDQGRLKVIFSTATGSLAPAGPSGIYVTDRFAQKYPEATHRVVRGILAAAYWISRPENKDEALRIWAQTGIPVSALSEDASGRPLVEQLNPLLDTFTQAQFRDGLTFAQQEKLVRHTFDVGQWIEPKYLNAALDQSGWKSVWPERDAKGEIAK
jgi:sulfonate transport system substrate-binding protein